MNNNRLYQLVTLVFLSLAMGCSGSKDRVDIAGKWKVVKAQVDGYSITHEYTSPKVSWIYFDENGSLLSGRELSEHSGNWSLSPDSSKLNITSSSDQWDNTTWHMDLIDSVLYLKGTKKSNNFTRKIWFIPADSEIPPFRKFSKYDEKLTGTWELLRIKRNSKLVDSGKSQMDGIKPRITFLESGIYQSDLPGEDQASGHGVWDLNEQEFTLSFFPFNLGSNKRWDYSFTGNLLRLSSTEGNGKESMKWEWVWQKSPSDYRDAL
jgi:hypothetical protein